MRAAVSAVPVVAGGWPVARRGRYRAGRRVARLSFCFFYCLWLSCFGAWAECVPIFETEWPFFAVLQVDT